MGFEDILSQYSTGRDVVGCQSDEITAVEKKFGVSLPNDYKQFLMCMGHRAPDFFVGSDFEYNKLPDLQEGAAELLQECGQAPLAEGAFVFIMHQGYQFYFFDKGRIYYYMEDEDKFEERFSTFEEFFIDSTK